MTIMYWILDFLDSKYPEGLERKKLLEAMEDAGVYKRATLNSELSNLVSRGMIKTERVGKEVTLYPLFTVVTNRCEECGNVTRTIVPKEMVESAETR